ncbi:MAG: class I SAM-dependent methyltransferase [bacterium]|nr:class I SAM-dependent methyltransferase [Candidatus Kapabacteria bacterium]
MNYATSSCCETTDKHFSETHVSEKVRDYHRGKIHATTRMLIAALRDAARESDTIVDIGGGFGAIPLALLEDSRMDATLVDISTAFLDAARTEARERGVEDRMTFIHGDAAELPLPSIEGDIVVLDRVVCCYDDWQRLIDCSTTACARTYAFTYPRDNWLVKLVTAFMNWRRARAGNEFRTHVHSVVLMDTAIQQAGFSRVARSGTIAWEMALYRR